MNPPEQIPTPTPRTDEQVFYPNNMPVVQEGFAAQLEIELIDCQAERDRLEQWKKEALAVESWWAKIDAFIRTHPDTKLGHSVSATALEFLEQRDRYRKALERIGDLSERTAHVTLKDIGLAVSKTLSGIQ